MLVFWIIMAIVVAMIAKSKNRSALPWFIYGIVVWPIALVHIILTKQPEELKKCPFCSKMIPAKASDCSYCRGKVKLPDTKKCPFCAEEIKWEASLCRFCGKDIAAAA